jgi:chemotaxis protein CheX
MSPVAPLKPEQIKPFVEGTVEVFESLLKVRLKESPVEVKNGSEGTFDVSAVIGLTGAATGSFVLSAPCDTARSFVRRMLGDGQPVSDQDMVDGTGELLNILAGRACQKLGGLGMEGLFLSLPTVVVGRHRVVWPTKDLPCLLMRFFDSELGSFSIEVNLKSGTAQEEES